MAKAKNTPKVETKIVTLEDLSREELVTRYEANKAQVKELYAENKALAELYKTATSTSKTEKTTAKLEALQAKLAALTNPSTPAVVIEPVAEVESVGEALVG
jgi:hypothetical protein